MPHMGETKGASFASRLKRLMGSMSPRHIARELDVSEGTVYQWLAVEDRVPRGEHVAALAQMFGVTADYLLGIEPAPDEPEPDPDLPEGAEPVGEMVLIPLYARVTAGEGGVPVFPDESIGDSPRGAVSVRAVRIGVRPPRRSRRPTGPTAPQEQAFPAVFCAQPADACRAVT